MSGALLTYLADKYGDCDTPEARARASQWVLFANSTLANALFVEQFRCVDVGACWVDGWVAGWLDKDCSVSGGRLRL